MHPVADHPSQPPLTEPMPASFAALMGTFRARFPSEVQAARALDVGNSTLANYCDAISTPTDAGLRRLASKLGVSVDGLTALVDAQRAAQARGEVIATVAPVRTRIRRLPINTSAPAPAGEGA